MAAFRSAPLFFLSLTLLLEACSSGKASPPAPAPPEVSVMTVAPETVSLSSEWIGTLDGYVNAQIRPQVSGYLLRRSYQEGALVRQGQVLFEIDPRLVRRQSSGCLSARWRIALTLSFDPLRSLSVWTTCGHRLIGPTPDDETWPFAVGDVVRCEPRRLSGGVVRPVREIALTHLQWPSDRVATCSNARTSAFLFVIGTRNSAPGRSRTHSGMAVTLDGPQR